MNSKKVEIMKRLKVLAVNTAKLCLKFPNNIVNKTYIGQIIRCSSSASANYGAACRGKSKADFVNKLRIAEEELDEIIKPENMIQPRNFGLSEKSKFVKL